jgi:hypothetical protein
MRVSTYCRRSSFRKPGSSCPEEQDAASSRRGRRYFLI